MLAQVSAGGFQTLIFWLGNAVICLSRAASPMTQPDSILYIAVLACPGITSDLRGALRWRRLGFSGASTLVARLKYKELHGIYTYTHIYIYLCKCTQRIVKQHMCEVTAGTPDLIGLTNSLPNWTWRHAQTDDRETFRLLAITC